MHAEPLRNCLKVSLMKKPIRYLLFSRIAFVTAVVITIGVISESVLSQQDNAGAAEETKRESPEKRVYIRLHESEEGAPLALQTNIVSFKGTKGPYKKVTVDLIGAIHVGDKSYYETLNTRFTKYEAVLYELVAPEGTRIPKGGHKEGFSLHPISGLQNGMKSMLKLEHQLEQIDYTVENLVHADMTPEEFDASMKERNEGFSTLLYRSIGQGLATQGASDAPSDLSLIAAFFSKDRDKKLKLLMAKQFAVQEGLPDVMSGPDGSAIITARNDKALGILKQQLKTGKKHVAVFYGAGHLRHMEEVLTSDFSMKRVSEEWVDAWQLK